MRQRIAQHLHAACGQLCEWVRTHPAARWAIIGWIVSLGVVTYSGIYFSNHSGAEAERVASAYSHEQDIESWRGIIEACERNNERWLAYNRVIEGMADFAANPGVQQSSEQALRQIASAPHTRPDGTTICYEAYPKPR